MSILAYSQSVVYSITLFVLIVIALFYCLTGRGRRAGDIAWLLEGIKRSIDQKIINALIIILNDIQVYLRTCGVH